MEESENVRSPPVRMIESGRNVWSVGWPSMLRPLMYFRPFDAPGAEILMDLPAGSAISARSNSGVLTVRSAVPGVIGYRPRAAQTYQLDSAPRSSLPGSPPGVGRNKSLRTRSTVSWVFHG